MKTLLLALTLLAPATAAFASSEAAQLQIFTNYNAETRRFESKTVSTQGAPVSADILVQERNAVCYRGSVEDVQGVLDGMLEIYNHTEANKRSPLSVKAPVHAIAGGNIAFKLSMATETGATVYTWASVRRCIR